VRYAKEINITWTPPSYFAKLKFYVVVGCHDEQYMEYMQVTTDLFVNMTIKSYSGGKCTAFVSAASNSTGFEMHGPMTTADISFFKIPPPIVSVTHITGTIFTIRITPLSIPENYTFTYELSTSYSASFEKMSSNVKYFISSEPYERRFMKVRTCIRTCVGI